MSRVYVILITRLLVYQLNQKWWSENESVKIYFLVLTFTVKPLYFARESLFDHKVSCEISFHNLVSRYFCFYEWTRGLVKRNRHATLPHLFTRWHCELRKGTLPDYHDSWFLALGFPQGVSDAQFCRISRECKLSGIFKGKKVANLKIPGFFSEKYILNRSPTPPPRFFSGIAHCWFTDCCYTA